LSFKSAKYLAFANRCGEKDIRKKPAVGGKKVFADAPGGSAPLVPLEAFTSPLWEGGVTEKS